jgi:hypothetical protein
LSISGRLMPMNIVPVQNVISGLIEPFPLLVLIVTCLVGDQQPFACLTKASHVTDAWGCDTRADTPAVQKVQTKANNNRTIIFMSNYNSIIGLWPLHFLQFPF